MSMPGTVICIDPGTTSGFAIFIKGKVANFGELKKDQIFIWLDRQNPDLFVVENYRIRPRTFRGKQTRTWDNPFALRILGAVESQCQIKEIPLVIQEPAIKPIGYGFLNMPYVKGKKNVHHLDAIAHGAYYFVKHEGVSPQWLQDRQKEPLPETFPNF